MKRKAILIQLRDLKYNFENFIEVETTEADVEALGYAIKVVEKENDKCNCCSENNYVVVVDSIKLCKECLERLKEISL